eukprot:Rmarinus@m.7764
MPSSEEGTKISANGAGSLSSDVPLSLNLIRDVVTPGWRETKEYDESTELLFTLTELRLDRRNIAAIDALDLLSNLTSLYLQHNRIRAIENLDCNLKLQFLVLSHNRIEKIENLSHLPLLRFLDLSHNLIDVVNEDDLPSSLFQLLLHNNPCSAGGAVGGSEEVRRRVIRALPHLKSYDNVALSEDELAIAGEARRTEADSRVHTHDDPPHDESSSDEYEIDAVSVESDFDPMEELLRDTTLESLEAELDALEASVSLDEGAFAGGLPCDPQARPASTLLSLTPSATENAAAPEKSGGELMLKASSSVSPQAEPTGVLASPYPGIDVKEMAEALGLHGNPGDTRSDRLLAINMELSAITSATQAILSATDNTVKSFQKRRDEILMRARLQHEEWRRRTRSNSGSVNDLDDTTEAPRAEHATGPTKKPPPAPGHKRKAREQLRREISESQQQMREELNAMKNNLRVMMQQRKASGDDL